MPTLLEMAAALVQAQIEAKMIFPEGVNQTLVQTFETLEALKAQEEGGQAIPLPTVGGQPTDWRKSITKSSIACLECGMVGKQLTVRHLLTHGLDSRLYRTKYGMPPDQPLAARNTTSRRQEIVRAIKPWENSPTYQSGRERRSAAVEALPEVTETPAPQGSASPLRQRKTTPKKQPFRRSRGEC